MAGTMFFFAQGLSSDEHVLSCWVVIALFPLPQNQQIFQKRNCPGAEGEEIMILSLG